MGSSAGDGRADGLLVTGYVRSAHGLGGFVRVESVSGEYGHIAALTEAVLRFPRSGGAVKTYRIEAMDASASSALVKFVGVDGPDRARELAGAEILVPRDMACPLAEGEHYVDDLCQCVLVHEGTPVATVIGVVEGGTGDLLEVALTDGSVPDQSANKTRLVPLCEEFVGKIDTAAKTVELKHRWILE